jgi:hypothetical protein
MQEHQTDNAQADDPFVHHYQQDSQDGMTMAVHDTQKRSRWERYAFPLFLCALCLLILLDVISSLLLTPTVIVTIVPVSKTVALTQSIDGASIYTRVLTPKTTSQSQTTPATGHKHQAAAAAHGSLTFYNGEFVSLSIHAGTIVTSAGGVQVTTDQNVIIPAGSPPYYGRVSVAAHAAHTGSKGNIAARAIDQACCYSSVWAVNVAAFSGGQNTGDFSVVTSSDIQTVAASLDMQLSQLEQADMMSQLMPNEALATPACPPTTRSNHQVGEIATQVTVTVSEQCHGVAYDTNALHESAVQLLSAEAAKQYGSRYNLIGGIQINILGVTITNQQRGSVTLQVSMSGVWAYQINAQQIKTLIAGQSQQEASRTLLAQPGIRDVSIVGITVNQQIPNDLSHIQLLIRYSAS